MLKKRPIYFVVFEINLGPKFYNKGYQKGPRLGGPSLIYII